MRLLAIGDIHGCLTAFNTLLDLVSPQPDDQIITLGDYVDRGPDSCGVLDRLIALHADRRDAGPTGRRDAGPTGRRDAGPTGRLIALRGNHDAMMLDVRCSGGIDPMWLSYGGNTTLRSYGIDDEDEIDLEHVLARIPEQHWTFLEEDCLPYYETEEHIFVHANLYPDVPLEEQPDYMLYWERLDEPVAHVSGKTMICGHSRQKSGVPLDLDTSICIDTNIYDGGWLTCLDVLSGRIWQANEQGETRTGRL